MSSAFLSYVIAAVIFLAILLVIGLPRILARVTLPGDFIWKQLSEMELSPEARQYFTETTEAASKLGFRPFLDFTIPGFAQQNAHRVLISGDNAVCLLASVYHAPDRVVRTVEFASRFQDDTALDTGNAPLSFLFEEPDWKDTKRYPGVSDLAQLHGYHQARMQKKTEAGIWPKVVAEGELMEEIRKSQLRQMEYQVSKGILKKDEAAGVYRSTPKIALRGIRAFLNPFADDFTWLRLGLGMAGGVAIAIAWSLLSGRLGLGKILEDYLPMASPAQVKFLALAPAFILSGLFVGWQFPQKGFLWAFLISLPALYFMPAGTPYPLYFSLLAAQAGITANRALSVIRSRQGGARVFSALLVLAALAAAYYIYVK